MNKNATIIGFAVCPACQMSGNDADSCRANQLSDGRILCVNCGSYTTPFDAQAMSVHRMPQPIQNFVAAMLREKDFHSPFVRLTMATFGPNGDQSQAAAACAHGAEGAILNFGALIFLADRNGQSKLEVAFHVDELQDLPADFGCTNAGALEGKAQQFLRNLKLNSCPPALETAIGKLISMGFVVRHADYSGASMRRIQLHCGGNIARTSTPKGILVEATYLV